MDVSSTFRHLLRNPTPKNEGISLENRFFISDRAHLVCDYHKKIDVIQEEMKGGKRSEQRDEVIGPAYWTKLTEWAVR